MPKSSLLSMTGYGRAEIAAKDWSCLCEIRSVNHRGLDVKMRLSHGLWAVESEIMQILKRSLSRGHIEVSIDLQKKKGALKNLIFDEVGAESVIKSLQAFGQKHRGLASELHLRDLLLVRELFAIDESKEFDKNSHALALRAVKAALSDLVKAREKEGRATGEALKETLADGKKLLKAIQKRVEKPAKEVFEDLKQRLKQIASDLVADETRLAQEAALLADKADVLEEIQRLGAHISHFESLVGEGKVVGRKLDFLCQEMFREANTIGSKSADVPAAHLIVELKSEIERLREQVQNIE